MKEKFLSSTISFLCRYNRYSESEVKKLRYGLEGIYLTITKTIIIFILSLILGIFKEILLMLVFSGILRYFAFGFHAEKSYECLILSILNFIVVPFLLLKFNISMILFYIICGLCILIFIIYAPADTYKRPLKNPKKRLVRKILTLFIGIIYSVIVFIFPFHYISKVILCSLIATAVVVNPITYFIFGQPYNNYKRL